MSIEDYYIKKYEISEWKKCYVDVKYFASNYFTVMHPLKNDALLKLHEYQSNILDLYTTESRLIGLLSRQIGISTLSAAYMLWKAVFFQDQSIAIISDSQAGSFEILERVRYAYEYLPSFLKNVTLERDMKSNMQFSHGSRIMTSSVSSNNLKSRSLTLAYFDNFSYGNQKGAEYAYHSVMPAMSFKDSQIIIGSTPNKSTDFFATLWKDAIANVNGYKTFQVPWHLVPKKDPNFAEMAKKQIGEANFAREYECQFIDNI